MKKPHNDELPPLPDAARFAIASFRSTKPSAGFESRLEAALEDPQRALHKPEPARHRRRLLVPLVMMGAAAAASVAIVAPRLRTQFAGTEPAPVTTRRQVAVTLPSEGPGWAHLPLELHAHGDHVASVRVVGPAPLDVQAPTAHAATPTRSCDRSRCEHHWVARRGNGDAHVRVQIHEPGRYEFRVTHASRSRLLHEHFVVLATR